jgi:Fur family iron response transcriptional regulator
VTDHHHFFIEGEEGLVDIPGHDLSVSNLPKPPEGMEIARVEVVVRLRKTGA